MKTIKHHLTDDLLIAYAAGNMPEAFSLIVATHISMCDTCRAALAAHESVGGALIEDTRPTAVTDDLLARTLASIERPVPAPVTLPTRKPGKAPGVLQDYIGGDLDAIRWKNLGGGVRQSILKTGNGASARLLFIPAGKAVPDHGHRGTELTLVLQGAFADSVDRFGPGDIEIATEELDHTPVAEMGEDCICLAATDAPLRFNALIPRLLQPIFRI
jgi:putative transcriptional regulator